MAINTDELMEGGGSFPIDKAQLKAIPTNLHSSQPADNPNDESSDL